jgi:hypothetical protein
MPKTTLCRYIFIVLIFSGQAIFANIIFGPQKYYGRKNTPASTNVDIAVPANQLQDVYKIKIKNADGQEHALKTCTGNAVQKIICQLSNLVQSTYINIFRVDSAEIYLNNQLIISQLDMNKTKFFFEKMISPLQLNQLQIKVKGLPTSYIEIQIERSAATNTDVTPPLITSNQTSNTIVNNNLVHISVVDASSTVTRVWNNQQQLIGTYSVKEFDLVLNQGINNFVIQSIDAGNLQSSFFYLSNINLDTVPAVLNSVISTEYIFSSYPQTVSIDIISNEDLKSLKINGTLAIMLTPRNFSYLLQINHPQTVNLNFEAIDFADNVTTELFSTVFNIDNIAPSISTNLLPNLLTNQSEFTIHITDNSQTTTEIYINDVLQKSTTDKSITANLIEGINNIRIRSFDIYNNQSIDTVLSNIQLDTQRPQIISDIKSQYFYKNLPFSTFYQLTSSELLSTLKINGQTQQLNQNLSITSQVLFETVAAQTITIEATDLAGNQTVFTNTVSIAKDDTAPEIILPQLPTIILTSSYLLNIQINEVGEVQTVVKIDDQILSAVSLKNFSVLLDFPIDQTKNIQITSTDAAGNQSQKLFSIRRDTSPLKVDFITPQSYSTYPSRTVQVRLRANKPLVSATLNTIPISLNADQISFGQNIEVANEGQYTFTASVTDIFGNTSQTTITFEIKTRSVASWEYQECPAE